jgi:hypothetical protein
MPGDQAGEEAQRLARAIHRAGMGGTARVALEVLKPLHWIAGQFAWAMEPFLGGFGPLSGKSATSAGNIARLLEREDGVSELSTHLDVLLREEHGQAKAAVKEKQP